MDDKPTQENSSSLDMFFDIEESIVDNLEDFIYLGRLGCIEDAQAVYDKCLVQHQDQFFPILAEYATMLLENGKNEQVRELLSETTISKHSDRHQKLLGHIVSAAERRESGFESPEHRSMRTTNSQKECSISKSLMTELIEMVVDATQESFNAVEFQSLYMQIVRWATYPYPENCWVWEERYEYNKLCKQLCSISRFWEAKQLLLPIISVYEPLDQLREFKHFFLCCGDYLSQQSAKVALLASRIECVSLMARESLEPYDKEDILNKTADLLRYFFDGPMDARGRLYSDWRKYSSIRVWDLPETAVQVQDVKEPRTNVKKLNLATFLSSRSAENPSTNQSTKFEGHQPTTRSEKLETPDPQIRTRILNKPDLSSLTIEVDVYGNTPAVFALFHECVQGYRAWSDTVLVSQELEYLKIRIQLESLRFDSFCVQAGLYQTDTKLAPKALFVPVSPLLRVFKALQDLLVYMKKESGYFLYATWESDRGRNLLTFSYDLDYVNTSLITLLDELQNERQKQAMNAGFHTLIYSAQDIWTLRQFHLALDSSILLEGSKFGSGSYEKSMPLLMSKETRQNIEQNEYFSKLVQIKARQYVSSDVLPRDLRLSLPKEFQSSEVQRYWDNPTQRWIEWTDAQVETEASRRRIQLLAAFLREEKPKSFRTPGCEGYTSRPVTGNRVQYGLIFRCPDEPSATGLLTLRMLLDMQAPSFTDKIGLCTALAECIYDLHTVGSLHKDIRSENIVFMEHNDRRAKFLEPYLIGFVRSLSITSDESYPEVDIFTPEEEIYRHPDAPQRASNLAYRISYDLWSLAVVFIEIALWSPIEKVLRLDINSVNPKNIRKIKSRLQEQELHEEIASVAGDTFVQVIKSCLTASNTETLTSSTWDEGLKMQSLYNTRIINPLKKLQEALTT